MRTLLVASLFATSALLNAQSITKGQGGTLEARNVAPAPITDAAVSGTARRVTTGVVAPKLISQPSIRVTTSEIAGQNVAAKKVVVAYTVDEKGIPQNMKLVESVNQTVDARVLSAVSAYRYEPATLDERAVPVQMSLVVNFTK